MYREITKDIQIEVEPACLPDRSDPDKKLYFYSYLVRVTNIGAVRVQLVSRKWLITDGKGVTEEIAGPGVIGLQPWIGPGETFEYSSFCPLETRTGNMRGWYRMEIEDGSFFEARVPTFFLRGPPEGSSSIH